MSMRRTCLVGHSRPSIRSHPSNSLVDLLKRVIAVYLELAHRCMISVDRNLFFVLNLEQGGVLLDDLDTVSGWGEEIGSVHPTRLDNTFIGRCS
jgi:hypothetical protein